jgi:hypothetical protein
VRGKHGLSLPQRTVAPEREKRSEHQRQLLCSRPNRTAASKTVAVASWNLAGDFHIFLRQSLIV